MQYDPLKESLPPIVKSPLDEYRGSGIHTKVCRKKVRQILPICISKDHFSIPITIEIPSESNKIELLIIE